jgi:hypothetical protein
MKNCQCGQPAVELFPKYAVDAGKLISKPYCASCLKKMKAEVTKDITKDGRLN